MATERQLKETRDEENETKKKGIKEESTRVIEEQNKNKGRRFDIKKIKKRRRGVKFTSG